MVIDTGVYLIRNKINKKVYVGSSAISLRRRWVQHQRDLDSRRHSNRHLLAAWHKYGSNAFEFVVLVRCHPDDCLRFEQQYIDKLQAVNSKFGYNLSPTAGNTRGVIYPPEIRQKVALAIKKAHARPDVIAKRVAIRNSPEFKKRHAESMKKVMSTDAYRKKMSASVKIAHARPEIKAKISAAIKKAYEMNPEYRRKASMASTGRKHTEEAKAKISASQKSPESIARNRAKHLGKKLSEDTKKKIGEGNRKMTPQTRMNRSSGVKAGWIGRKARMFAYNPDEDGYQLSLL